MLVQEGLLPAAVRFCGAAEGFPDGWTLAGHF